jgi:hypothetical protein
MGLSLQFYHLNPSLTCPTCRRSRNALRGKSLLSSHQPHFSSHTGDRENSSFLHSFQIRSGLDFIPSLTASLHRSHLIPSTPPSPPRVCLTSSDPVTSFLEVPPPPILRNDFSFPSPTLSLPLLPWVAFHWHLHPPPTTAFSSLFIDRPIVDLLPPLRPPSSWCSLVCVVGGVMKRHKSTVC